MKQADAMVSTGLAKHGYQYVNIDEGWWLGQRDKDGGIVVDAQQWPAIAPGEKPGDMANIVRYLHKKGLKAGIYTDAGESGCGFYGPDLGPPMPHTGSEGHYEADFLQFAQWGFDYVKVDWCGGSRENLDPAVQYAEIARAVQRAEKITGHRLYLSICEWGHQSPWTWAPGVGGVQSTIWRTTGDIVAPIVAGTPNANRRATLKDVLRNFDDNYHPEAQHTGYFNDADMMVIGMPGLNERENRVHLVLWAMAASPLLLGADLTTLTPDLLSMLTNDEILAVDRDPVGLQAIRLSPTGQSVEVWAKLLAPGADGSQRIAIALLNRSQETQSVTLPWSDVGLASVSGVRNLWTHQAAMKSKTELAAEVPAGDIEIYVVAGKILASPDPSSGRLRAKEAHPAGDTTMGAWWSFDDVKSTKELVPLQIEYVNPSSQADLGEIRVNGERRSVAVFPSTVNSGSGRITIQSMLRANEFHNHVEIVFPARAKTTIRSLRVFPMGERVDEASRYKAIAKH